MTITLHVRRSYWLALLLTCLVSLVARPAATPEQARRMPAKPAAPAADHVPKAAPAAGPPDPPPPADKVPPAFIGSLQAAVPGAVEALSIKQDRVWNLRFAKVQ